MKAIKPLIAALALAAMPANAATMIGNFQLNGSTANAAAGPLVLANNGGALGAMGISFGAGQGPTVSGFSNLLSYTVEVVFSLNQLTGFRRLVDFKNKTTDRGLYSFKGFTTFFPGITSSQQDFHPAMKATLVLNRSASGLVNAFVDGNPVFSFNDALNDAMVPSSLEFFNDDLVFPGEESSGFVDSIRIFDDPLSPQQLTGVVPEPGSWMLLIAGFVLVGAASRSRSHVRHVLA